MSTTEASIVYADSEELTPGLTAETERREWDKKQQAQNAKAPTGSPSNPFSTRKPRETVVCASVVDIEFPEGGAFVPALSPSPEDAEEEEQGICTAEPCQWEGRPLEADRQRKEWKGRCDKKQDRFTNGSRAHGCLSILQRSRMQHFSLDQQITHVKRSRANLLRHLEVLKPNRLKEVLAELGLGDLRDEVLFFVHSGKPGNFIDGTYGAKKLSPQKLVTLKTHCDKQPSHAPRSNSPTGPSDRQKPAERSADRNQSFLARSPLPPARSPSPLFLPARSDQANKAAFFLQIERLAPIANAARPAGTKSDAPRPCTPSTPKASPKGSHGTMKPKRPKYGTATHERKADLPERSSTPSPCDTKNHPGEINGNQIVDYLFMGREGLPRAGWTKEIAKLCAWAERTEAELKTSKARER